jgi:hypothetical protein
MISSALKLLYVTVLVYKTGEERKTTIRHIKQVKEEKPPLGKKFGSPSCLHVLFLQTLHVIMMYTEMLFILVTEM